MRSSTLRVCSRTSAPTSPVAGLRPVCPDTKTRSPKRVAGDRLGFPRPRDSGAMISFCGMTLLLAVLRAPYPLGKTRASGAPTYGIASISIV